MKSTNKTRLTQSITNDLTVISCLYFLDTDYARLPPIYHMDGYEECFDEPDSLFCFGEFVLVSDEPSELLNLVQASNGTGVILIIILTDSSSQDVSYGFGFINSVFEDENLYEWLRVRDVYVNGWRLS